MSEAFTVPRRRVGTVSRRPGLLAALMLLASLFWSTMAAAVGQPSTYAGCQTRDVTVNWGDSVYVNLVDCQWFGLGDVDTPPDHGTTTEGTPACLARSRAMTPGRSESTSTTS